MGLAIVILNFRTPALTVAALESVVPCLGEWAGSRIILVDNASGDDSVARLREAINRLQLDLDFVVSERNLGFAGGNNLALERLRAGDEAVLLLNSDTVFRPGVLEHFRKEFEADRGAGVWSCRLESADGSLQANARRLPTPTRLTAHMLGLTHWFPKAFAWADLEDGRWDRGMAVREVEWVGGAFMLVRREVIERVGGLDSTFFFYGEDAEFCARVRRAGWRVRYDGRVGIVHLGGGSSDPAKLAARAKSRYSWEARYLLQRRVYGRAGEWWVRAVDVGTYALRCVRLWMAGGRRRGDYETHREILRVLWSWPVAKGAQAPRVSLRREVSPGSDSHGRDARDTTPVRSIEEAGASALVGAGQGGEGEVARA